jgi:hypothetical protein
MEDSGVGRIGTLWTVVELEGAGRVVQRWSEVSKIIML